MLAVLMVSINYSSTNNDNNAEWIFDIILGLNSIHNYLFQERTSEDSKEVEGFQQLLTARIGEFVEEVCKLLNIKLTASKINS